MNIVLVVGYLTGILIMETAKYEVKQAKGILPIFKRIMIIILAFLVFIQFSTLTLALILTVVVLMFMMLSRTQLFPGIMTLALLTLMIIFTQSMTSTNVILLILVVMMIGSQDYIRLREKKKLFTATALIKIFLILVTTLLVLI